MPWSLCYETEGEAPTCRRTPASLNEIRKTRRKEIIFREKAYRKGQVSNKADVPFFQHTCGRMGAGTPLKDHAPQKRNVGSNQDSKVKAPFYLDNQEPISMRHRRGGRGER